MHSSERLFTPEEDNLIRQGFESGVTDLQMVEVFAEHGYQRTRFAIYGRRRVLGYRHTQFQNRRHRGLDPVPPPTPGDHAFKRAMLAALKQGTESAIVGVVKDRRPVKLTSFQPEPTRSGIGSSAAQCADA